MHKIKNAFFSLLLFLFSVPACTNAQQNRVISLAPSLTKNVYFLGAQDQLVGCTSYCTEALADNKEVVASAIKVNIEKTVSLKPNLILVTTITEPETITMLEKFDIQVEVFSTPKNTEEVFEQFRRIGKLLDKTEEANKIITSSEKNIKKIKELQVAKNKDIFFQIGAEPIFSVLPGTFMNDYISILGGKNIATDVSTGAVTRESVVAKNPDIIFVVTMGITGEEECEKWHTFKGMKATNNKKIFIIDAEKACSPTPVTFVETLDTLVSLLNPAKNE
jgi:iron complex transport system substrate-binding protein